MIKVDERALAVLEDLLIDDKVADIQAKYEADGLTPLS